MNSTAAFLPAEWVVRHKLGLHTETQRDAGRIVSSCQPLHTQQKILYIEDDRNNRRLVERILRAEGYQVSTAPNGSIGLAKAHREQPDLILVDIYMPDLSGYQVIHRLRRIEKTKNIPIVVVTASSNKRDQELSAQAGCDGFITKPIDRDKFYKLVTSLLEPIMLRQY